MAGGSYRLVPTPAQRRRSGKPAALGALGIAGVAAAAIWLYFRKADPKIEERTRERLAPRLRREV